MAPPARVPGERIAAVLEMLAAGTFPWWYPDELKGGAYDYFVYGSNFLSGVLVGGATITNPININSDSHFCILSATMIETDASDLVFLGNMPLLVALSEAASGRQLSNTPIAANNWFGTAQLPKYWDVPKILAPNSTFNVGIQNLDTVNARTVRVAFHGFKIYGFARR
mgnify:CR=1 FL=1